jgi:hypothetical protein
VARERLAGPQSQAPAAVSESVRSLYDQVVQAITALGGGIEMAPKKGYVSLRRRKQFGMLQAGARGVNLGLVLHGVEPAGRLESAAGWNALFTHRVRIASSAELDDEIRAWLRDAYLAAS